MHATTLALVGAAGGAGTTRTAVELATVGARGGRNVAVLDAAFATQGLSEYVRGRIGTDLTALVADETGASLSAATYRIAAGGRAGADGGDEAGSLPGRADVVPARAPFERVARAKTAEAARKLERRIDEAASAYDAVIVDASPVASNEAVAAVTAAESVAAVRPATPHGSDALQRLHGRIADVGASVDATVAVSRGIDGEPEGSAADADVTLPRTDPRVAAAPVAATGDGAYARAIANAYARLFDTTLDVDLSEEGLIGRMRS
ncbi:AAA family ATPase [Halorubrum halodurans]|uniref:Cell division inhibitor n=1 Tax=Halorubrum halodurans TaxID=1383851 RepID=A0A256IJ38_9EURY|nr:AAA family ATPase [Halorubrum halodurans]OYR56571.1 cell division inhibitor [Halorubrum halodurans]